MASILLVNFDSVNRKISSKYGDIAINLCFIRFINAIIVYFNIKLFIRKFLHHIEYNVGKHQV